MKAINSPDKNRPSGPARKKGINGQKLDRCVFYRPLFFPLGTFYFFSVGVGWPPAWRYGIMPDVPGQSVYSVQGAEKRAGTAMLRRKNDS